MMLCYCYEFCNVAKISLIERSKGVKYSLFIMMNTANFVANFVHKIVHVKLIFLQQLSTVAVAVSIFSPNYQIHQ